MSLDGFKCVCMCVCGGAFCAYPVGDTKTYPQISVCRLRISEGSLESITVLYWIILTQLWGLVAAWGQAQSCLAWCLAFVLWQLFTRLWMKWTLGFTGGAGTHPSPSPSRLFFFFFLWDDVEEILQFSVLTGLPSRFAPWHSAACYVVTVLARTPVCIVSRLRIYTSSSCNCHWSHCKSDSWSEGRNVRILPLCCFLEGFRQFVTCPCVCICFKAARS